MKKMRLICMVLIFALVLLSAGCEKKDGGAKESPSPEPSPTDQASPSPEEPPKESPEETETPELGGGAKAVLEAVLKAADSKLSGNDKPPMSFESGTDAEGASGLGLTKEQYEQYVEEGYVSTAAISASAHEVAVLKCMDKESAAEVKKLIADGFDPGKWICVRPERCTVADAEEYVLLAASATKTCDGLLAVFEEIAGDKMGGVNEFYTRG